MTITLSDEEYRRLVLLTFLGEWVVNAIRKDPDPAFEDAASKFYSFAKGAPLESLVRFDELSGAWMASESLEDEAHALLDQYDDKTFWEELTARLTERDLIAQHGERAVGGMRPDQRTRAAKPIAQAYTQEFEDQGIDRLEITSSPFKGED